MDPVPKPIEPSHVDLSSPVSAFLYEDLSFHRGFRGFSNKEKACQVLGDPREINVANTTLVSSFLESFRNLHGHPKSCWNYADFCGIDLFSREKEAIWRV